MQTVLDSNNICHATSRLCSAVARAIGRPPCALEARSQPSRVRKRPAHGVADGSSVPEHGESPEEGARSLSRHAPARRIPRRGGRPRHPLRLRPGRLQQLDRIRPSGEHRPR
eukprot:5746822-Prymnesium_polylepis.1